MPPYQPGARAPADDGAAGVGAWFNARPRLAALAGRSSRSGLVFLPQDFAPMMPAAVLLFAAVAAPAGPDSADWPQFRGPGGQGHAPAGADPPVAWADADGVTTNVAWSVPTPPGWSSPVVVGDRVYLTAAEPDGDAAALAALCLGAADGAELWRAELFAQPDGRREHAPQKLPRQPHAPSSPN